MALDSSVSSWVDQFVPSRSHPREKRIWLRSTGTGLAKRGFLYFNKPFDYGQTLDTLKLHIYSEVLTGTRTVSLDFVAAPGFDKGGISGANWTNQPSVSGSTISVAQTAPTDGTEWVFDIKTRAQTVSDAGKGWFGFRLTIDNDVLSKFYSSYALTNQPWIEVAVSDAPEQPTMLIPDGGVVSLQKTWVRCDFTDLSGDQTMRAIQVQLDAANNFVSGIDFDTGTVLTDTPQLDLSTTAWAGLADAASIYWRTRVQDGSTKWSPWSDPAFFTRRNKSTLTITNPPVSGLVTEFTPPITWTFGGTQTGFRVIIERIANVAGLPDTVVHDSEYVNGTATSYTLPVGVLTEDGQSYRVTVRAHDQYDRENLPGDPQFVSASRTFTVTTGATTAVSALAAQALLIYGERSPFVKLTWTRATAPDSFTIKRDGKVIDADLDPSALLVSGTNYAYTDYGATSNVSHTWKVQANVNGINSVDSSVVTSTVEVPGVWLYDNDFNNMVLITGVDPGSWEMPENAAEHMVVNARTPIRITAGQYGWRLGSGGDWKLVRTADGSQDGNSFEAMMMKLKQHPNRPIWINAGDRAARFILYDIVCPLLDAPGSPTDVGVSFGATQVKDFTFNPRTT
jgi:hypothetical protein